MLFVIDIGLIAFLTLHAYQDGMTTPHTLFLPLLTWQQLTAWIVLRFPSLAVWRVLSSTQNKTCCMISIHLGNGATAFEDTHVIPLRSHRTAMFSYYTNNHRVKVLDGQPLGLNLRSFPKSASPDILNSTPIPCWPPENPAGRVQALSSSTF